MEKKIPLVSFGLSSIALLAFAGRVEGTLQWFPTAEASRIYGQQVNGFIIMVYFYISLL